MLDTSLALRAAQGATVNLGDIYAQAQEGKRRQQQMDMQSERFDFEKQQAQTQAEQAAEQKRREGALNIARLTSGVSDPNEYQKRLAAGQQMGMDVSSAPPWEQGGQEWVQQQNIIAQTFLREPQKLSTAAQQATELTGRGIEDPQTRAVMANILAKSVSVEAGGSAFTNNPVSGVQQIIAPNDGSQQGGAPVSGGIPAGAVDMLRQNPSLKDAFDQKYGQGASARVLGGGVSNGTSGF